MPFQPTAAFNSPQPLARPHPPPPMIPLHLLQNLSLSPSTLSSPTLSFSQSPTATAASPNSPTSLPTSSPPVLPISPTASPPTLSSPSPPTSPYISHTGSRPIPVPFPHNASPHPSARGGAPHAQFSPSPPSPSAPPLVIAARMRAARLAMDARIAENSRRGARAAAAAAAVAAAAAARQSCAAAEAAAAAAATQTQQGASAAALQGQRGTRAARQRVRTAFRPEPRTV